jgi:hypothetical protein
MCLPKEESKVKRLAICAALAAVAVMGIAAGNASAGVKPLVKRTCVTTSKNVTTKNVSAAVVGTNVASKEMQYTRCPIVTEVMGEMLSLQVEKPKLWEGFHCTPSVGKKNVVAYKCVFKGADTATVVRFTFTARYKG